MLSELAWYVPVLLAGAAFLAGFVDAVVGGGGLIQLPALLMVPGFTPVLAVATNKVGSIAGTITSSITYWRRLRPDLRVALPMAVLAFAGSYGGAIVAKELPTGVFTPIILVALIVVLLFTIFKPRIGSGNTERLSLGLVLARCLPFGAVVGFYDGVMGPGTGSFLVLGIAALAHFTFLEASASAKIINTATNLGALVFFVPQGLVVWSVGLLIAVANMVGGYVGARTAVKLGNGFVRLVLIVVVTALLLKLALDML
ncbi:TSUP family transporter [Actinomycetaceae bacterium L2_0104]